MKPDWDKLANEYKKSSSLVVADVDCTADGKSLCEEFSVSGYPTIKTIRNGDKKQVEDYDGGRGLSALRSSFARPAKAAMRLPRLWGDTDERYHRRLNRSLKTCLQEKQIPDLDVYVLARLYAYAGHLVWAVSANPAHLTGHVLNFRNAEWKRQMTEVLGHQGHHGRHHPWNWERQFHSYFKLQGEDWQQVALNKSEWYFHRSAWIQHMLGSRAASTNLGAY